MDVCVNIGCKFTRECNNGADKGLYFGEFRSTSDTSLSDGEFVEKCNDGVDLNVDCGEFRPTFDVSLRDGQFYEKVVDRKVFVVWVDLVRMCTIPEKNIILDRKK